MQLRSVSDFNILKQFTVKSHPTKANSIKQVSWKLPNSPSIKCNADGAARGNPSMAGSGGLFIDGDGHFLGAFTTYIGIKTSLCKRFCCHHCYGNCKQQQMVFSMAGNKFLFASPKLSSSVF